MFEELKAKEKEKKDREEAKKAKVLEREQKKKEREERKKEKAKANTWKKGRVREKETVDTLSILNPSDESGGSETGVALESKQKKGRAHENETIVELLSKMNLSDEESGGSETDESDAVCPKCGVLYSTDRKNKWVGCDGCGAWYHVKCTHLKGKRKLPEDFL